MQETFQVIVTTDGNTSFALFKFVEDISVLLRRITVHSLFVGVDSGDGERGALFNSSIFNDGHGRLHSTRELSGNDNTLMYRLDGMITTFKL